MSADHPGRFPIQRGPSVPWEVVAPHESMAQKNHQQSLKRLAERGGLSPGEAWCVVSGIDLSKAINGTKEQWDAWNAEWFKYAERVNLYLEELERLRKVASEMRAALELALPYVWGEGTDEETIAVKAAIAHAEELGLEGK